MADPILLIEAVVFAAVAGTALFLGTILFRKWLDRTDAKINGWAWFACFGLAGYFARATVWAWAGYVGNHDILSASYDPLPSTIFAAMVATGITGFTIAMRHYRVVVLRRPSEQVLEARRDAQKRQEDVLANSPLI